MSLQVFYRFGFNLRPSSEVRVSGSAKARLEDAHASVLKELFATKQLRDYLFPMDRIVVAWVPHKVIPENIPLLFWYDNEMLTDVAVDDTGNVKGLLTSLTSYPCSKPEYCLHLDVYGSDMTTLKWHLRQHLLRLSRSIQGSVFMYAFCEPSFDIRTDIDGILHELGMDNNLTSDLSSVIPQQMCLFQAKNI